ncbi:hypothetical protein TEQG_08603 [Trichophyton equinum CBS 127.97]|uniref:Uncharacterized protein n=1 Tax=Trichophyton equinum (strain ATCC MYA-4606 / CBS 127.97) TaxID=559882 RepID=F2PKF6_TRIEC|nr:hypothetical protein TEQG_08603 [Trichophyton equinum CBS 127.97]
MLSQLFCCLPLWQPISQNKSTDEDLPRGQYNNQQSKMNYKPKGDPTLGMTIGDTYTQDGRPSTVHSTINPSIQTVTSCSLPHPPGLYEATFEFAGRAKPYTIKEIVKDDDLYKAVIKWDSTYKSFLEFETFMYALEMIWGDSLIFTR